MSHSSVTSIQKVNLVNLERKKRFFFQEEEKSLGNITKNTPFGIFGGMQKFPDSSLSAETCPDWLGRTSKRKDPAKMMTIINGQK